MQQSSTAHRLPVTRPSPTAAGSFHLGSGGSTTFNDSSTADSATLVADSGFPTLEPLRFVFMVLRVLATQSLSLMEIVDVTGGAIVFNDASTGGTARVEVFDNGYLDIGGHQSGVTIGSIEGSGNVFLGANSLTVGTNDINTSFSGVISNGKAVRWPRSAAGYSLCKPTTASRTPSVSFS